TLKKEIEDLLALTSELNEQPETPAAAASAAPAVATWQADVHGAVGDTSGGTAESIRNWRIGDQCEARYAADGKYYPARVVAVRGGSVFQVAFVGYGDMQETRAQDMQETAATTTTAAAGAAGAVPEQRKGRADGGAVHRGGKIEKNKSGRKKNGSAAATAQQAWLAFAKGSSGASKKLKAKAINDKSIFKSPDTVNGKVGVARH
ncbi:hypothetical protein LPJ56_005568, partial [Coemansia sp. RSA 2599]